MSPAADREPSAKEVMEEVLRVQDQIVSVQGQALQPEDVSGAVADGIRAAVSDPAMWAAAVEAMQTHAKTEAGGWLLRVIKGALSKALLFAVVGLAVYSIGGWSALASLFKTTQHP
jgi:hypothetical protein